MATLRRSDVSGRVASKLGGSKAQGESALKAVLDSIQDALGRGDRVVLTRHPPVPVIHGQNVRTGAMDRAARRCSPKLART